MPEIKTVFVSVRERLRAIREEKGPTQESFTQLLGTSKQVRTIIMRRMKDAPLSVALRLSDMLNVPLEVWTGEQGYKPGTVSVEAYEVARAYDRASAKDRNVARLALDLETVQ